MGKAPEVNLSEAEQRELERWTRARTLPVRQVVRAKVVLLAGQGADDTVIADLLGITRQRSGRIRNRYLKGGPKALEGDLPRCGRPRRINAQKIVELTTANTPESATDWSRALMAKAAGISASSVGRIWRKHGLIPKAK